MQVLDLRMLEGSYTVYHRPLEIFGIPVTYPPTRKHTIRSISRTLMTRYPDHGQQ